VATREGGKSRSLVGQKAASVGMTEGARGTRKGMGAHGDDAGGWRCGEEELRAREKPKREAGVRGWREKISFFVR